MTRGTDTAGDGLPRPGRPDSQAILDVLEPGLARHFGRASRIRHLSRRPFEYSTSFALEAIDLTLDDGHRLELVFKDVGPHSLIGEASKVRPRALYDPRREIAVYQHVLADRGLCTPICYAAAADAQIGRYWLFLERVPAAARLCHVGDFAAWTQAARWLARLHARHGEHELNDLLADGVPLLRCDEAFYRAWPARARRHVAGRADVAPDLRRALEQTTDRYQVVIDRLLGMRSTLNHGEFYGSNILVRQVPSDEFSRRVCPIDWELAAVGPGLLDLAALTAGTWTAAERDAIALAYRSALADAGRPVPPIPEFLESLNWCRLHVAMHWLGWAENWQAPADLAHDWLNETVTVADSLGI
jgi:aminoglycoside phosphotransferase (APT) family kinase protein